MRKSKIFVVLTIFFILINQGITQEVQLYLEPGGPTLNNVCGISIFQPNDASEFWVVGDSGVVMKLFAHPGAGNIHIEDQFVLLNGQYNFQSVSFASRDTGWIVGYKRDEPDKWRGVILKTSDGGRTWIPQLPPLLPILNTPFLKVHAVNSQDVWISCGNGEVLRTTDGGINWYRKTKPCGSSHYGWLWGIWANHQDSAWVCSDQSGYYKNIQSKIIIKNYK